MSKPGGQKPVQTVQTLIAPRKDLAKKDKDKDKTSEKSAKQKRTHSDVEKSDNSLDISVDFIELTKDLQDIKKAVKGNIKKEDLTNALKDIVRQSDIEEIVTNIVQKLLTNFKNEIKKKVDDQISKVIQKQSQEIEELKANIVRLNKKCIDQYVETNKVSRDLDYVYNRAEEAISMANYS